MNRLGNFILRSCGYTVLLMLVLYVFLAAIGGVDQGIPFIRFLVLLRYGAFIVSAGEVYKTTSLKKPLRILIHYFILLIGFVPVYVFSGASHSVNASKIFIALMIFSILYAFIGVVVCGIRSVAFKRTEGPKTTEDKPIEPKPQYTPRFTENSES